jgi:hypothetical protein
MLHTHLNTQRFDLNLIKHFLIPSLYVGYCVATQMLRNGKNVHCQTAESRKYGKLSQVDQGE